MSTEAHKALYREIAMLGFTEKASEFGPQLLAASEARAVEAARTMLSDAWREETTAIQHALNDAEISDFPLLKGVQKLAAALAATAQEGKP